MLFFLTSQSADLNLCNFKQLDEQELLFLKELHQHKIGLSFDFFLKVVVLVFGLDSLPKTKQFSTYLLCIRVCTICATLKA